MIPTTRLALLAMFTSFVSCGGGSPATRPTPAAAATAATAPAQDVEAWPIPAGWRSETIPFPLEFAPSLGHRGVEELRFAPGFFDPAAPGYWSYAFAWRTEDAADLDAAALGGELTSYFRGLIDAVDETHKITAREAIIASATAAGPERFTLAAHVFDAFKTGAPLDLAGTAVRLPCASGALWVMVLAPSSSALRSELDALSTQARCGQPPVPNKKRS